MFNKLNTNWKTIILHESKKDYFIKLMDYVNSEYQSKNIFPKKNDIFRCFNFFDFEKTSLVIIGQDPYYISGMADGLAFSTKSNIFPKSLQNIFKELKNDLNIDRKNYDLQDIAAQNVLLLNSILTVQENKPLSHKNKGWETFVDNIIKAIDEKLNNVIFLLMGNNAIKKEKIIKNPTHFIIRTSHPSPLGYHHSFKNSKIFSKINSKLVSLNKKIIIW